MHQSETDMAEQIFLATDRLMARDGLNNLSMHKIAKEAHISAGTIYIYFKSKDELLAQFAENVFARFEKQMVLNCDVSLPFFEQYRQMWKNIWHYLVANPTIVSNIYQYKSLPNFVDICKHANEKSSWCLFCQRAKQENILIDLPVDILFSLSMESAMKLAFKRLYFQQDFSEDMLEIIIERTWRSIQL